MSKNTNYFGIDISKDSFDVYDYLGQFYQFSNDKKGFKEFKSLLDEHSHCVMEATGYYHQQLAYYLVDHKMMTSVENPLTIKRFIQMKLSKIKTDKSDAKQIYNYAKQQHPKLWFGESKAQQESLQLSRLLDVLIKQRTMLKNKLHGEKVLGTPSKIVKRSIERQLKNLVKECLLLEESLLKIVKENHNEMLTNLRSIPGVGPKTAIMLIVFTDGFNRFEKASELCSYSGLTPIIKQSGSSVNGRPRISKIGNRKLRNLLFMCSFNACKCNLACKQLYDRIVAKGKSKKLALIAVCNKLLKQAFAIAKSGVQYDANYRSVLKIN